MALAEGLSKRIEGKSDVGHQDNCISYGILSDPMDATKWKPGIGAAVNERPLVLFLLIILVLAVIESILSFVAGISRLTFLLMALVFSLAFHSAPDSLIIRELYLGIVISERPDGLNGHDSRILSCAIKGYSSWPRVQLLFGFLFAVVIFLPTSLFFVIALFLLLAGIAYLGQNYSISEGVSASVPS